MNTNARILLLENAIDLILDCAEFHESECEGECEDADCSGRYYSVCDGCIEGLREARKKVRD